MEIAIKEMDDNCLVFNTLKANFNSAQHIIKKLEKQLSNQNASFEEERKKNKETIDRMEISLKEKDQWNIELDWDLVKTQEAMKKVYTLFFNNAIEQMKHIFTS